MAGEINNAVVLDIEKGRDEEECWQMGNKAKM